MFKALHRQDAWEIFVSLSNLAEQLKVEGKDNLSSTFLASPAMRSMAGASPVSEAGRGIPSTI